MKSNYFNPETYEQTSEPFGSYDYGVRHCSNITGNATNGFIFSNYPIKYTSSKVKKHNRYGSYRSFKSADAKQYINTFILARIFWFKSGLDRQKLLVENLGFDEVGSKFSKDKLFVYKYCTEKAQLEVYIDDDGNISEINRFHQEKFYEIRLPIHILSIQHIISQIFYDICELNLNNINFSYYDKIQIQELLDLSKRLSNVDFMDFYNIPPIHDFNSICLLEIAKETKSLSWFSNIKKKFFS